MKQFRKNRHGRARRIRRTRPVLEFLLCSVVTILPDFLVRRYLQGKRWGHEITFFSMWYELRWGVTACVLLTVALITLIF